MQRLDAIFLAGATATGKSSVASMLARQVGGEIISVDSMQVYRGLDIGTAKPAPAERAAVPHHLLDVAELHQSFDAAQFRQLALQAEEEIRRRGRIPIYCGGTGLYFKVRLEGLGGAPGANPELRAELEQTSQEALQEELRHADPELFAKIDLNNPRRLIRAIEVIRLTGKAFSGQRAPWRSPGEAVAAEAGPENESSPIGLQFGLSRSPADLRARIDHRVEQMFARGLVAETRALLGQGLAENKAAMQAIGYRQAAEHLRGERSLPETIALVKTRTWQFAKRQGTWFRRQLSLEWIDLPPGNTEELAVEKIVARLRAGG